MSVVIRLSSLSILSLIVLGGATVTTQYRFESWTADEGLPQNSVRSIIQTRDGYLWLTTFDGLVRFDGVRFTVFDKSNTGGLRTNRFTSLHEDRDGTLWAGTGDGSVTLYRDGVFTSYTTADGLPASQVMCFAYDLKGELLVNMDSGRFYMRDGRFVAAPPEYQNPDMKFYLAPSGAQWTITKSGTTQEVGGRATQYALKLTSIPPGSGLTKTVRGICGWATGLESTGCGTDRSRATRCRTACRRARCCDQPVKTMRAASGSPRRGWRASKTGDSPSTGRAAG